MAISRDVVGSLIKLNQPRIGLLAASTVLKFLVCLVHPPRFSNLHSMKTSQKTGVKIGRHLLVYYACTYRIQIYCENIRFQGHMAVYRAGRSCSQLKP